MTFSHLYAIIIAINQSEVLSMKKDMDKIVFESRYEISEVIQALEEWQKSHKSDSKADTVERLINLLDVMCMEW